jgi:hypothetical protein
MQQLEKQNEQRSNHLKIIQKIEKFYASMLIRLSLFRAFPSKFKNYIANGIKHPLQAKITNKAAMLLFTVPPLTVLAAIPGLLPAIQRVLDYFPNTVLNFQKTMEKGYQKEMARTLNRIITRFTRSNTKYKIIRMPKIL